MNIPSDRKIVILKRAARVVSVPEFVVVGVRILGTVTTDPVPVGLLGPVIVTPEETYAVH